MSDPVSDLKQELLAAAERQQGHAPAHAGRRRWRGHPGRSRLLLTAATLAIATALALLITAPWSSSPGFLARAEAALTPPPGSVLHMKWEMTSTPTTRGCTVTRTNEIWIDQTPQHRYRGYLQDYPPAPDCSQGTTSEVGGTFDPLDTFRFKPPNTLIREALGFNFGYPTEPVREAIDRGFAHDEGETQLDGRTVRRIRIDEPRVSPSTSISTLRPTTLSRSGRPDITPRRARRRSRKLTSCCDSSCSNTYRRPARTSRSPTSTHNTRMRPARSRRNGFPPTAVAGQPEQRRTNEAPSHEQEGINCRDRC